MNPPEWLTNGQLTPLVYVGPADDRVPGIPHLRELVSSDRDRSLVDFLEIGSNLGWPLFGPPEIPADRLDALRQAFAALLEDQAFADAIRTSMRAPLKPTLGADLEAAVTASLQTPESVIEEAKELLGL